MSVSSRSGRRGLFWRRIGILFGALGLLWLCLSLLWSEVARPLLIEHTAPEAWRQLYGEVPPLIAERKVRIRKANINDVPIAIPSNYLALVGIEYKDQSIWAPRDPDTPAPDERTFDDAAGAFTVAVRWPDLEPRGPETETSYRSKDDRHGDPWLRIGVGAYSDPEVSDRGWAPVVTGTIERIAERTHTRRFPPRNATEMWGGEEEVRIHYEMRGTDSETGLKWAEPVGPGTERFHSWNQSLYWKGDLGGDVSDMIKCDNGRMPNPDSRPVCRHRFNLPEWGAWVDFNYPRTLLPQWKSLKTSVRDLILSFEVKSADIANKPERSIHKESD